MEIYNLYSKPYTQNKYEYHFSNVPVERLTYYPDMHEMYLSVAYKTADGDMGTFTGQVPENLMKVVVAHASKGRRIAFFTDRKCLIGHIFFGEESHIEILRQIDEGFRPVKWGDPSNKEWQEWKKTLAELRKCDPGKKEWGYAKVLEGNTPKLGFRKKED